MNFALNTDNSRHQEIDLEQLYSEQSDAQAVYELALTYKSFGFRDKAIKEFYHLCELRTGSAEHYSSMLAPLLFS